MIPDAEEQELRADQSMTEYPDDYKCPSELLRKLNDLYQGEYLENERRYPISDMWEREEEARRGREESAEPSGLSKEQ